MATPRGVRSSSGGESRTRPRDPRPRRSPLAAAPASSGEPAPDAARRAGDARRAVYIATPYAGETNQLRAVCAVLVGGRGEAVACSAELRSRNTQLLALLALLLRLGAFRGERWPRFASAVPGRLARLFLRGAWPPVEPGDVVVSKLNRYAPANAVLAQAFGARNIHLGPPKRTPRRCFTAIVSSPAFATRAANVELETAPSLLPRCALVDTAPAPKARTWALFVGGAASGFAYTPDDWAALTRWMIRSARAGDARWMVTTSRRTPPSALAQLRAARDGSPDAFAECVWYGETCENPTRRFLAASEFAVVTEDSASMVSDVLNAGRPLLTVAPAARGKHWRVDALLAHHASRGSLVRATIPALDDGHDLRTLLRDTVPIEECWREGFLRQWRRVVEEPITRV